MRQHTRKIGIVLALAAAFSLGALSPAAEERAGPRLFQDVFTLVAHRYVDSLDVAALYEKAARGLIEQLEDPYAAVYSPEELEEFTVAHEGHYGGVGMMVENQDGAAVVARVFPNTPSEHAGVLVGDRIVSLDGQPTRGWELSRVANGLRGEPGSEVEVQFIRPGADQPIVVTMVRAVIHVPAVPYSLLLDDGTGYIPLQQFSETAADEVGDAVRRLIDEGATGLVLDLRGNGGGIVDQAIAIAGLFLPPGTTIARQWERGAGEIVYRSHGTPIAPDIPLVVLIDQWSASASEIVAGALQDHDRAVVVGTTSFGKGSVQSAFRLDGGYILKMTTGKWFTPSGRTIQRGAAADGAARGEADRVAAGRDDRAAAGGDAAGAGPDADGSEDALRANRPVYQSAGGRTIYGGGGIVPDLIVSPDTLSTAEQDFLRAVMPQSQEVYLTLFDYAYELQGLVTRDFQVRPEWRDEFYRRLRDRGVEVDRETYDAARSYVDRLLEDRIARFAFDDADAKRRAIGEDAPLRRALELLRGGPSLSDIFVRVDAEARGTSARRPETRGEARP